MSIEFEIKNAKQLRQDGDYAKSKDLLLNLAESTNSGWAVLEYARTCMLSKDYDECIKYCINILGVKKFSDVYNVYAALGELYESKGDMVEAVKYFKAGFEVDFNLPNAVLPYLRFLFEHVSKEECFSVLGSVIGISKLSDDICYHFIPKISTSKYKKNDSAWRCEDEVPCDDLNSVIVMLVKDEVDVIYHSLLHHNKMGFKNFFILNNNSSDGTLSEIERAKRDFSKGTICVVIDDPFVPHLQGKKTTLLANFALSYLHMAGVNVDWVFPLDADEFINASSFSVFLNKIPIEKNVIAFQMVNLSSSHVIETVSIDFNDLKTTFCSVKDVPPDAISVKCAFKACVGYEIMDGNHFVKNIVKSIENIVFASDYNITLNHLPIRSVSQIRTKTINGHKSAASINVGQHWKDRYKMYEASGDQAFYKIVESFVNSK